MEPNPFIEYIEKKREERQTFGHQFEQGLQKSLTLGYAGESAPADLPLTGKIGRIGGELVGFAPFGAVGGGIGALTGYGATASEAAAGALYGLIENPEGDSSRLGNALKNAVGWGASTAVLGKLLGRGAGAGRRAVNPTNINTPNELEAAMGLGGEIPGSSVEQPPISYLRQEVTGAPNLAGQAQAAGPGFAGANRLRGQIGAAGPMGSAVPMAARALQETGLINPGQAEPFVNALRGYQVEQSALEATLPMEALANPKAFQEHVEVRMYDQLVNTWAQKVLKAKSIEETYMEDALRGATVDDVKLAAEQASVDAGLHNLGQTPMPTAAEGGVAVKHGLQTNIDAIVKRNKLTVKELQTMTNVKEPINYGMSQGMTYDDAEALTDSLVARAEAPATSAAAPIVPPIQAVEGFAKYQARNYPPEVAQEMFFNTPVRAPQALKHGLLEVGPGNTLNLTEKGFNFLQQYNPEGLTGAKLEGLDSKWLGAIRGRGYSNLNFTHDELRANGFAKPIDKMEKANILRPGRPTADGTLTWQLTSKGAGQLAGGRGFNANQVLKEADLASGLRVSGENIAGMKTLAEASAQRELLFRDLWDEVNTLGKPCEH